MPEDTGNIDFKCANCGRKLDRNGLWYVTKVEMFAAPTPIIIEEEEPIIAVSVIGSGCSSSAQIWLEAEPVEWKYPRTGVRMMKRDLWGIHIRYDAWRSTDESWNDAGLSCARFELPDCRRIIVGGSSQGADPHYCVRLIRVDVKESL